MFLCLIAFFPFKNDGHAFMLRVTVMNGKPADSFSEACNVK